MESNSELKYIFSNINDWLKFAEAKHAGIIILNSGLIIGILSCYANIQSFIYKPLALTSIICLGASIFLSLVSQFPVTHNIFYNKKDVRNLNLYFFGHLSHLDDQTFVVELQKVDVGFLPNNLDMALINQILINARIAQAKYSLFKYASYLTAFATGVFGLSSIIKIICPF